MSGQPVQMNGAKYARSEAASEDKEKNKEQTSRKDET